MTPEQIVDEVEGLLNDGGGETYGEAVSIAEHCLLTALAAEQSRASDALIAACLLHDLGHLIDEPDDGYGKHHHDTSGGRFVAARFPAAVSEPVRLHVAAKRYLVAVDPAYRTRLSAASLYTLDKQGGPMSNEEVAEFEATPFSSDAVQLRMWEDDLGKQRGRGVPSFSRYRPLLERMAVEHLDRAQR